MISVEEKIILENLDKRIKWIARSKNGCLIASHIKLIHRATSDRWELDYSHTREEEDVMFPYTIWLPFDHLFRFVQWKDREATNIQQLLEEEKQL